MSGTRSPSPRARATEAGCLLLVTHGVEGRPGSAAAHAATIGARSAFAQVRVACLKGEPGIEAALQGAPPPVIVVPLLMADGFIMALLRRRLAARPGVELRRPVGLDPRLGELIRRRALRAGRERGWRPEESTLLLVGHGTPQHARSAVSTRRHAARLRAGGGFAQVRTAFLDQAPYLGEVAAGLERPCIAVGLFLDDGPHGRDDVLAGLRGAGAPVVYTGAIGADPAFARLILDEASREGAGAQEMELMSSSRVEA